MPQKCFFNPKAMHSVNGHLWTRGRQKVLQMYKSTDLGMTPTLKQPLRDKHVIPTTKAVVY